LLFSVKQTGYCCHLGFSTCFHNKIFDENDQKLSQNQDILKEVFYTIKDRINSPKPNSYVSSLVSRNENDLLRKINEEAFEFILAIKEKNKANIIHEATDLIFHTLVALAKADITIEEIYEEFFKRKKEKH
ncbi:MAG: phosphoribosyl-ATP diphosphatase, partial [Candidatus Bathyarchaeia archaeon]